MLTNAWLQSNYRKEHDKGFEKADRDGLGVRVSPKGKLTWQMRYRFAGKAKRVDIGTYPAVSLKDARTECLRLRGLLERGGDPKAIMQQERIQQQLGETLEDMFYRWYEKDCRSKKSSPEQIKRSFEIHVFPKIGKLPIRNITVQIWITLLEGISENIPAIASRILGNAKQMYRWLIRRGWVDVNPLAEISPWHDLGIKKKTSNRALDDDELRFVLDAINHSRMLEKNMIFVKLCLLYGCRPAELRQSNKSDFDFDSGIWTVPKENHKMGRRTGKPLLRPITKLAESLIRQAMLLSPHPDFMFTSIKNDQKRMTHSALLKMPLNLSRWIYKHHHYVLAHWSIYDLRKTARTNWSTLTMPHVAEIMLGHKLPGDWQVYDQHHYLDEQAACLSKWGEKLTGMDF